jgi:protein-glutamine gamma-glutamyltransferase
MLTRLLKRAKSPHEPSIPLRVFTYSAQVVGIVAATSSTRLWMAALLSLILLSIGHWNAYRSVITKPNPWTRIGAFVGLHLALCWMFIGMFTTTPFPQAQFAMLAMAVISWELFSRMNLYSGFGLALGNLYVAATLSRDLLFGPMIVLWLGLLLAFLWVAESEDGTRRNPVILRPAASAPPQQSAMAGLSGLRTWGWRFAGVAVITCALIFLITPHYAGQPLVKPISFRMPIQQTPSAQIVNPAVPLVQIEGMATGKGEYYTGFDSALDLSYRGGLSDALMMYVRSPAWSYWRSHAFDMYDGRTWTQADYPLRTTRHRIDPKFHVQDAPPGAETFVQTFFITQPLPNVLFVGGQPIDVYVRAQNIAIDHTGGIRVGEPLQAGMIYSVVSARQDYPAELLRTSVAVYPDDIRAAYLQLPPTVSQRTRDLAASIISGQPTPYDQVVAVRDYLLATYPYDFYPPPQALNTDAVDQFLFVDQRGVCEHFVSAMVVMLRTQGIPARLAAGFGSGDFNRVTGYYEVHADDAHAWAEVYFPGYGWIPFDPTPGWTGSPQTGTVQRWLFSDALNGVDLSAVSLPLADAAQAGMAAMGPFIGPLLIGVGLGGFVALVVWLLRDWQRQRANRPRRVWPKDRARQRIFAAYKRAQRQLKSFRSVGQTAQEHTATQPDLAGLADLVDVAAYRPVPPGKDEIEAARRLIQR